MSGVQAVLKVMRYLLYDRGFLEPKLANLSPVDGILQEVKTRAYTQLNKIDRQEKPCLSIIL